MSSRANRITAQFAARHVAMLESPAYRVLSLAAHRVLSRIEVELGHHGGTDNGKLPVTYDDFVNYGIHRQSIRPAINELIALGFVEITRPGRGGNADFREPNLFRLTFRHSKGAPGDGTHEWRSFKTTNEAEDLARTARAKKSENQYRKSSRSSDRNRHRKPKVRSTKFVTTAHGTESITTLDISGRVSPAEPPREARQPLGAVASEAAANITNVDDEADDAAVQQRIAKRLGPVGWFALTELPPQELDRVTKLEALGRLDERELDLLRAIGAVSQSKFTAPFQ